YYDLSGRVVATKDANNNLNTRTLRAGSGYGGADPDTIKEFHADTGVFTNAYDAFGDRRQTTNEIGKTETYNYDAMDRLTSQVHQLRTGGTQLTDNYVYDGLGRRVQHWNSQLGSSAVDTTDYDLQGRV